MSSKGGPAEAVVKKSRGPSLVWIVPIVAALAAGWLWWRTIQEQGPLITITFVTADGLEAGKTKVKFKNVEVGVVETVTISDDLSHVIAGVRMEKTSEPHLTSGTRFWIVRPRIGAQGISGLSTIVSGAYIEIEPGKGAAQAEFTGLETPPVAPADAPGLKLTLVSEKLSSLEQGSSIFYRDVHVGLVEDHKLDEDGRGISLDVYIFEQYEHLVRKNTHFFNVSGIEVTLGASGFDVRTQALDALLMGGVAFALAPDDDPGPPAEDGDVFTLYDSYSDILELRYTQQTDKFVLYFDGSLRGLEEGAPVEFRGMKVGQVVEIRMQYNPETLELHIPVIIEMQRGRVEIIGGEEQVDDEDRAAAMAGFVDRGMRAQLRTGSIVTGALFVDLDFHPETDRRLLGINTEYSELPTIPSPVESLENTLNQLPQLFTSANEAVESVRDIVKSPEVAAAVARLDDVLAQAETLLAEVGEQAGSLGSRLDETARHADEALVEATRTLVNLQDMTDESSDVRAALTSSLQELSQAARSLRALTDYLERHPEALIKGKELP